MHHLDPVNAAIALASIALGPALAAVIGPYAVILVASTVGAAWSLGRRNPTERLGAAWYFLRLQATAIILTVGITELAAHWLGVQEPGWMLAPIALLVGGVGDDWPRLAHWAITRAGRILERRSPRNDGDHTP